jgi:hypothetical protein
VFFSYSHADEALRDQLEKQLSLLKRQGVIATWHDRRIGAGQDFAREIDGHIETDDIILLLVSADFLDSDYCYEKEMMRAMARHDAGEAIVIPVILRACDWHGAPFGKLNASPPDGKPVTQFADRDQALLEVAKAVRNAAQRLDATVAKEPAKARGKVVASVAIAPRSMGPRSSNLGLAKQFSERERDAFKVESFDYMSRFFESSLHELEQRNKGVETSFRRVDANRFTAVVYKNGRATSRCTVFMGGGLIGNGIGYLAQETTESNSYNEMLTVEVDDQSMYLRSFGMSMRRQSQDSKLSQEGASELYWSMFIEALQYR